MSQPTTTLYERLGRREGITRITADLMKNHLANPLVNARYMNSEDGWNAARSSSSAPAPAGPRPTPARTWWPRTRA